MSEIRPNSETAQRTGLGARWKWNGLKELAAKLVAEGELTHDQIAEQCKVTSRSIEKWKLIPDFQDRVNWHLDNERKQIEKLYSRPRRLKLRAKVLAGFEALIDERAKSDVMQNIPGGRSGMVCLEERAVGTGPNQKIVIEYSADTQLSAEIRENLKAFAQETGEWSDKHEVGLSDGLPKQDIPEWLAEQRQLSVLEQGAGNTNHSQPKGDSTSTSGVDTKASPDPLAPANPGPSLTKH